DDVVALKIDGNIVDLHSPVDPTTTSFDVVRATDKEGIQVIRHSTAHVMADAVQRLFPGTKVTIGPAIEDGFYYDFAKPGGGFTEDDLKKIERTMLDVIKADTPFRREVVTREQALALFEKMGETFKVEIIRAITASSVRSSSCSSSMRSRPRCRSSCRAAPTSTTSSVSTSARSTSITATKK